MTISANSTSISSRHWMVTTLPTHGTKLFMFSGIANFGEKIKGTGSDWERGRALISADYSNVIPINRGILSTDGWVMDVHLASIFNRNHAVNTGWAIDRFRLIKSTDSAGRRVALANGQLVIETDVAVRDSDAFTLRLSYSFSIVGKVIDFETPPVD